MPRSRATAAYRRAWPPRSRRAGSCDPDEAAHAAARLAGPIGKEARALVEGAEAAPVDLRHARAPQPAACERVQVRHVLARHMRLECDARVRIRRDEGF